MIVLLGLPAAAAPPDARQERLRKERRERVEIDREWRLKYEKDWRTYLDETGRVYRRWTGIHIRDRRAFDEWRRTKGLKRLPFRMLHR